MGNGHRVYFYLAVGLAVVLAGVGCRNAASALPSVATAAPPPPGSTPLSRQAVTALPTPAPSSPSNDATTAAIADFLAAHDALRKEWGSFRSEFDGWRSRLADCSGSDLRIDLEGWVIEFQGIVRSVTALEIPAGAAKVREILAVALTTEDTELRRLRDGWFPGKEGAFAPYEEARTKASILRQEAQAALTELLAQAAAPEPTPIPSPTAPAIARDRAPLASVEELKVMQDRLTALGPRWDAFHQRYDSWKERGGQCAATSVRQVLRDFSRKFSAIVEKADAIKRPSVIRPQGERLIEAAALETRAFGRLVATWAPYTKEPFEEYLTTREQVDVLLRQVTSDLDQLAFRVGLFRTSSTP